MAKPTSLYTVPHLREWRRVRYLTQAQLAAAAGLSRTAIASLENAKSAHIVTVDKLAAALGITREQLLHTAPPAMV